MDTKPPITSIDLNNEKFIYDDVQCAPAVHNANDVYCVS